MAVVIGVRFKDVGKVYYFDPGEEMLKKGDKVILGRTEKCEEGIYMHCHGFEQEGEQLEDHVARPDQPEQVEHGKTAEKGRPVQNGKDLRPQQPQQQCGQSRGDAEGQAEQVFPAHGYARFCCRSGHGIDTPIS